MEKNINKEEIKKTITNRINADRANEKVLIDYVAYLIKKYKDKIRKD